MSIVIVCRLKIYFVLSWTKKLSLKFWMKSACCWFSSINWDKFNFSDWKETNRKFNSNFCIIIFLRKFEEGLIFHVNGHIEIFIQNKKDHWKKDKKNSSFISCSCPIQINFFFWIFTKQFWRKLWDPKILEILELWTKNCFNENYCSRKILYNFFHKQNSCLATRKVFIEHHFDHPPRETSSYYCPLVDLFWFIFKWILFKWFS